MSNDGSLSSYAAKTEELRLQHAGLEIVLRMRTAIEQTARESALSGRRPAILELHIGRGGPTQFQRRGQELERLLAKKTLSEQQLVLEKILRPYANRGYIPNYHISEGTFVADSEPHAVIKYDFVM